VFENRALTRISGIRGQKSYIKNIFIIRTLHQTVQLKIIKSRRMISAGHIAHIWANKTSMEDNIKVDAQ
jgi:hypothetical protein